MNKKQDKFIEELRDEIKVFGYGSEDDKMKYMLYKELEILQKLFKLTNWELASIVATNEDYFIKKIIKWKWM